jgi:hypothetical protein
VRLSLPSFGIKLYQDRTTGTAISILALMARVQIPPDDTLPLTTLPQGKKKRCYGHIDIGITYARNVRYLAAHTKKRGYDSDTSASLLLSPS